MGECSPGSVNPDRETQRHPRNSILKKQRWTEREQIAKIQSRSSGVVEGRKSGGEAWITQRGEGGGSSSSQQPASTNRACSGGSPSAASSPGEPSAIPAPAGEGTNPILSQQQLEQQMAKNFPVGAPVFPGGTDQSDAEVLSSSGESSRARRALLESLGQRNRVVLTRTEIAGGSHADTVLFEEVFSQPATGKKWVLFFFLEVILSCSGGCDFS